MAQSTAACGANPPCIQPPIAAAATVGLLPAGHALDQKRLKEPLFRYAWDEVLYA